MWEHCLATASCWFLDLLLLSFPGSAIHSAIVVKVKGGRSRQLSVRPLPHFSYSHCFYPVLARSKTRFPPPSPHMGGSHHLTDSACWPHQYLRRWSDKTFLKPPHYLFLLCFPPADFSQNPLPSIGCDKADCAASMIGSENFCKATLHVWDTYLPKPRCAFCKNKHSCVIFIVVSDTSECKGGKTVVIPTGIAVFSMWEKICIVYLLWLSVEHSGNGGSKTAGFPGFSLHQSTGNSLSLCHQKVFQVF